MNNPTASLPVAAQAAARKLKKAWKAQFEAITAYELAYRAFNDLLTKTPNADSTPEGRAALKEHVRASSAKHAANKAYESALREYEDAFSSPEAA